MKPENIVMDEEGNVCLTDFGISRYADEDTGDVVGTVAYLSPETWL